MPSEHIDPDLLPDDLTGYLVEWDYCGMGCCGTMTGIVTVDHGDHVQVRGDSFYRRQIINIHRWGQS